MDYEARQDARSDDVSGEPASERSTASVRGAPIQLVPNGDGMVVLPDGATLDDIEVRGRDLVIELADGRLFVIPNGAVFVPQIVVNGVAVPPLNLAALLTGDEPQPAAGAVRSSGGNFADPADPIQAAFGLGDLLPYTELAFPEQPDEEILPGLINRKPEVLIDGDPRDTSPGTTVASDRVGEAGLLAARSNGVIESAGSAAGNGSVTTDGLILVSAEDGLQSLTINGVPVTGAAGQQIVTARGVLTLGGGTEGQISYSYTLSDNTSGDATTDVFTVIVTDVDGDPASATLTIDITDDVPTARNDTDSVAAGTYGPETGNVFTGIGTTSGSSGADTPGADGAAISGIRLGSASALTTVTAAGVTIPGQYGSLTINSSGAYTYTRSAAHPAVSTTSSPIS